MSAAARAEAGVGGSPSISAEQRYREVVRVTLVGAVIDLLLGVAKLVFGWLGQSQALIADGVHSLSDLVTDGFVLFASRQANKEADADHPYGHARIETVATVALGLSLLAVGGGVGYDALRKLFSPDLLWRPSAVALLVAAVSVVAKEAVYRYTAKHARRLRSDLLIANAWHSRTDALSSVFVIVGVSGALAGLDYVDAVAAIAVGVMIARIGGQLVWSSVRELIDTGLESARLDAIRRAILTVDGVKALHMLRTRRMAGQALVDVHILLENPRLSVSEGHQISEVVRARLIRTIDEVADVMVHIDPEDDEVSIPNRALPLRETVLERLREHWRELPACAEIRDLRLHYLDGRIHVEIVLPRALAAQGGELSRRFNAELVGAPQFAEVKLLYE